MKTFQYENAINKSVRIRKDRWGLLHTPTAVVGN